MGSKNVSIREDTYERLIRRKREDESFTELFERMLDSKRDIMVGFGAWEGTDAPERAEEARRELDEGLEEGVEAFRRSSQREGR